MPGKKVKSCAKNPDLLLALNMNSKAKSSYSPKHDLLDDCYLQMEPSLKDVRRSDLPIYGYDVMEFIMEAVQSSGEAKLPKYDCLLFDLDDTLYSLSTGVQAACRMNIEDYMVEVLKIDKRKVSSMCADLHKSHGTTMAGLKALGYEIDNDDFHSFVHGRLPYENLRPDPVLRSLLLSMPQRKIPKWNDALLEVFRIDFVGTAPYITCTPTLRHHRLGPEDHYLILSSDGLYQYFTNEEVVNHVEWFMSSYADGDPAQQLVEEVLFRAAKKASKET